MSAFTEVLAVTASSPDGSARAEAEFLVVPEEYTVRAYTYAEFDDWLLNGMRAEGWRLLSVGFLENVHAVFVRG